MSLYLKIVAEYGDEVGLRVFKAAKSMLFGVVERQPWYQRRRRHILDMEGGHGGLLEQLMGEIVTQWQALGDWQRAETEARNSFVRHLRLLYSPEYQVTDFVGELEDTVDETEPVHHSEVGPRDLVFAQLWKLATPKERERLQAYADAGCSPKAAARLLGLDNPSLITQSIRKLRRRAERSGLAEQLDPET